MNCYLTGKRRHTYNAYNNKNHLVNKSFPIGYMSMQGWVAQQGYHYNIILLCIQRKVSVMQDAN